MSCIPARVDYNRRHFEHSRPGTGLHVLFDDTRRHFFRPLNGKYRGQVADCLILLYTRLYGAYADYSRHFMREQVVEVLEEAIARSPVFDEDEADEYTPGARSPREQANWILALLLEHGWLERQMDEVTLQASYAFTRHGRLFTQPMIDAAGGRFRTRHRNTRNTRNALQSFLDKGEAYDLLDAYEYSERIVADFSDVIAELDERRRELVREVESQQIVQRASDEFFDFMEKRFMPDVAIRLSADSVEKYRDEIAGLIERIKRKRREFKEQAEHELRRAAPELIEAPGRSVLYAILDGIDARMHNASTTMLPALRQALNGFTRRADIIMRQLSYAGGGVQNRLLRLTERFRQATPEQQSQALAVAGEALATLAVGFVVGDAVRLHAARRPRVVNARVEAVPMHDATTRRELFLQSALDQAFAFNSRAQREYVLAALRDGHRVHSQNLPVRDARDLLMSAHAIEIGALSTSEFAVRVTPTRQRVTTDYFEATDEFTLELTTPQDHAD
ncbi:Wadjet anti-phage system protein JetA family protein [Acidihalobacter prosperus]|uniref:Ferrochelatase n=1 Tax=Acidihalobacter prosperus TaxID=160660 RepID=A0A1A6C8T7_9GAMM|nr:Wadjet anti-phage system protein JetA family protein [Acidihalobacter prosperus]OBS10982.1 ferrochelatase [Acidihalobacter prosperus]